MRILSKMGPPGPKDQTLKRELNLAWPGKRLSTSTTKRPVSSLKPSCFSYASKAA